MLILPCAVSGLRWCMPRAVPEGAVRRLHLCAAGVRSPWRVRLQPWGGCGLGRPASWVQLCLALLWVLEPACLVGSLTRPILLGSARWTATRSSGARSAASGAGGRGGGEDGAARAAQAVPTGLDAAGRKLREKEERPGRGRGGEGPRRSAASREEWAVPPQLWLQTSVPGWFCSACIFCRGVIIVKILIFHSVVFS